ATARPGKSSDGGTWTNAESRESRTTRTSGSRASGATSALRASSRARASIEPSSPPASPAARPRRRCSTTPTARGRGGGRGGEGGGLRGSRLAVGLRERGGEDRVPGGLPPAQGPEQRARPADLDKGRERGGVLLPRRRDGAGLEDVGDRLPCLHVLLVGEALDEVPDDRAPGGG